MTQDVGAMVITTLGPQNQTDDTTYHVSKESLSNNEILKICLYIVIVVIGVTGNGLVIFVTSYKMKTTVNSIWFLNLAIADLIFVLFLICSIVFYFQKLIWLFGDLMCKCFSFMISLNMLASVFFLTVISVDRCLCTWFVVWAQNKRTLVKARIISVFVWILSICCSIPYPINRSVQEHNGLKLCVYNQSSDVLLSLFTYRFMVGFLIPFLIIVSSYIAICVRVKRLNRGKQLRPYWVIISVILAFFICCFPFHVQQLCHVSAVKYNWSDSVQKVIDSAGPFVNCLIYLNSCLNPILYVFMCDEYKKKLKKSLLLVFEGAFTEEHLGLRSTPLPHNCQFQQMYSQKTQQSDPLPAMETEQANKL
ncbi:C3a anaphylatoxin chemotactic receptor-like [Misgurnus anguillicaudatus]|uniref:C3a anaphylatoxin chemotactic receptor-like n=1 Tax=Misgurnus anguillicaudatus TaxID=75329 RepID=UPI003CCF5796